MWLPDEQEGWIKAVILEEKPLGDLTCYTFLHADGRKGEIKLKERPLTRTTTLNEDLVDDLTGLSTLNEAAVLNALRCRYLEKDLIYTRSGIVLVSINPYRELPDLYATPMIEMFARANPEQLSYELAPHLYSVAAQALRQLMETGQDQTVIVSGESGAGKTVNARHMMRYFAMATRQPGNLAVEERVLATNPLLEAFGNARTVMNDNSSRFGKYVQLFFDCQFALKGARLQTFLLEKTRVVKQAPAERNYHIFYQLLGGADANLKAELELNAPFAYLTGAPEPADVESWRETVEALTLAGFDAETQSGIWNLLAAILHLGNLQFPLHNCDTAARLLGVAEPELRHWLQHRQIQAGHEVIDSPLTSDQAEAGRDALAKWLYAQLFAFLIDRLNENLEPAERGRFIGVLDIYGFECFESGNGLEQLCINWANERLQAQFIEQVFRLEQAIYAQEGIPWQPIDYGDNAACIELIEGKGLSLVSLLDEETRFPKATDASFVSKVREMLLHNPHLLTRPLQPADEICIAHSAYPVSYQVNGWLEKNRDAVSEQLKSLCHAVLPTSGAVSSSQLSQVPSHGSIGAPRQKTTVSLFKASLVGLMDTILQTAVQYVRCIKPNDEKKPNCIDAPHLISQLRACGIMETIRISAAGYPARPFHADFIERYGLLTSANEDVARQVLSQLPQEGWAIGHKRIFLRAGVLVELEMLRLKRLHQAATCLQTSLRGFLALKRHAAMLDARHLLQQTAKMSIATLHFDAMRQERAAMRVQTAWRSHKQQAYLKNHQVLAMNLSAVWRGRQAREKSRRWAQEEASRVIAQGWQRYAAQKRVIAEAFAGKLIQACVHRRRAMKRLQGERQAVNVQTTLQQRVQTLSAALHLAQTKAAALEQENSALQQRLAQFETQQAAIQQLREANEDLKHRLDCLQAKHCATQSALFYERHPPLSRSTHSLPEDAAGNDVSFRNARSSSLGDQAEVNVSTWNRIPAVRVSCSLLGTIAANVAG